MEYGCIYVFMASCMLPFGLLAEPLDPVSLYFEKDYQVRNFFNSSIILSRLDVAADAFSRKNVSLVNVACPGCTAPSRRVIREYAAMT